MFNKILLNFLTWTWQLAAQAAVRSSDTGTVSSHTAPWTPQEPSPCHSAWSPCELTVHCALLVICLSSWNLYLDSLKILIWQVLTQKLNVCKSKHLHHVDVTIIYNTLNTIVAPSHQVSCRHPWELQAQSGDHIATMCQRCRLFPHCPENYVYYLWQSNT